MAENPLKALEKKIDALIALCQDLDRENQSLKDTQAGWRRERKELIDKNELARNKVETMIDRLRALE
jgi:cell division protein ZapB